METIQLYDSDPFLKNFTAVALSCQETKTGFRVVLNQTAFYPEGGGQPADHGQIGTAQVSDVQEQDGVIFHSCDKSVETGVPLPCSIDWARRFDHMQQHSGEHIISGILCADYHCNNVGFHLGAQTVTIDYDARITWEQALDAERKANEVLWADPAVEITYPDADALAALEYRSKKALSGQVRIVRFPQADCCACCGTHVSRAGQVGLIKVLSLQPFREGVRLEILCGQRAFSYLSRTYDQAKAIGQLCSVKPQDSFAAVERMEAELNAQKLRCGELEAALFSTIAENYRGKGDVILVQPPMKGDSVRRLADAVARASGGLAWVFAGEGNQYAYAAVHAQGQDISPLVKALNQALNGRGGGRNGFAQGSVQTDRARLDAYVSLFNGCSPAGSLPL